MRRKLSTLFGVATLSVGLTAMSAGAIGIGAASASPKVLCTIVPTEPATQFQQYGSVTPNSFSPVSASTTWTAAGCTGSAVVTVTGLPPGVTETTGPGKVITYSGTPSKAGFHSTTVKISYGTTRSASSFAWANEQVIITVFQNARGCTETEWATAACPATGPVKGATSKIIGNGFPPGDSVEVGECNADSGQTPPLGADLGEVSPGVWAALVSDPVAQCTAPATPATAPYLAASTFFTVPANGAFTVPFHVIEGQLGSDTASQCPGDQAQTAAGVLCILAAADVTNSATFDTVLTFANPAPPKPTHLTTPDAGCVSPGPCTTTIELSNPGTSPSNVAGADAIGGFSTFGVYNDGGGVIDSNCQGESSDAVTTQANYYSNSAETSLLFTGPTPWAGLGSPPAPGGVAWTTTDVADHPGVTGGGSGDPGVCNAVASDALFIVGWGPAIDGSLTGGSPSPALAPYAGCTTGAIAKSDFSNWLVLYATSPSTAEAEPYVGCIFGNSQANSPAPEPLGNGDLTPGTWGGFDTGTALDLPFNKGGAVFEVYGGKFTLPHIKIIGGTPTAYPALGQQQLFVFGVVYPSGVNY